MLDGLNDLPSLAVSLNVTDYNYLYKNHRSRGKEFERAASIELIYPNKKQYESFEGFQNGYRMSVHD